MHGLTSSCWTAPVDSGFTHSSLIISSFFFGVVTHQRKTRADKGNLIVQQKQRIGMVSAGVDTIRILLRTLKVKMLHFEDASDAMRFPPSALNISMMTLHRERRNHGSTYDSLHAGCEFCPVL